MNDTMTLSGTTYFAVLSDIEPVSVTQVGYGCRVKIPVEDSAAYEALVDRLSVAAADFADEGEWDTTTAIYKDIERADLERGMVSL